MKQTLFTAGVLSAFIGSALAASSYNFESETANDFFTGGVAGWSQPVANPVGPGATGIIPMAYLSTTVFSGGGSLSAFIGTRRANRPDFSVSTISGDISDVGPMSGGSLSLNFAVADSSVAPAVSDDFGFNILDSNGATVASVFLLAATAPGATAWNIGYSVGGGGVTLTGSTVAVNSAYYLLVSFQDGAIRFTYGTESAGTGTNLIGEVTTALAAGVNFGSLEVFHDPSTAGASNLSTNALVFDNINVTAIPEPTSALLLGVASLGLLRRRRA